MHGVRKMSYSTVKKNDNGQSTVKHGKLNRSTREEKNEKKYKKFF